MKVVPFIAETPAAALRQIYAELGPEAVVLSVRPLPAQGMARLWQKSRSVEVIACLAEPGDRPTPARTDYTMGAAEQVFRSNGFLPSVGMAAPLDDRSGRPHVFIGPPGVGKTTLLCKWMTRSVLTENRCVRVWRLDGVNANTAEFLNVYAEMLGASVERFCNATPALDDLLLVDLPGVQPDDVEALRGLKEQLAGLPSPRIHLVLNAAYDTSILNDQFRAFAPFAPEDLSFCHLDEEKRPGKLCDFVLGTNCSIRFLSTGQKIPGDFSVANATQRVDAVFAG